jgi:hypothetical protein
MKEEPMDYSFDLVGVSPVLSFFDHQQKQQSALQAGAAYVGAYQCTLDAFLDSLETVPRYRGWNLDDVVDTVIQFWITNGEKVQHWKSRLDDAGRDSLVVGRVADVESLKTEFEALLGE